MKKLIVAIILNSFIFSVGEAGAIFLLISPSPAMNGYGGSGVSAVTFDAYSSHYNPAHSLIPEGASFQFSNMSNKWLPNLVDDLELSYDVKTIGYNGYNLNENYKLQFLLSQLDTYLALGNHEHMEATSRTFSIGIQSTKHPIQFSFGMSNKEATQVFNSNNFEELYLGGFGTSTDTFNDWGFRFLVDNIKIPEKDKMSLTYSLGYSKSNIGDYISFIDNEEGDPAPTTARLGMTFGLKKNIFDNYGIEFKSIREVSDVLVGKDGDGEVYLQEGMFGDIDLKHIFLGNPDENVTIHKGIEINIFDFYSYREGEVIDIDGRIEVQTEGYSVNVSNLLSFFTRSCNFNLGEKVFNYFDLEYNYSQEFSEEDNNCPRCNISYDEYRISLKNIDKLVGKLF